MKSRTANTVLITFFAVLIFSTYSVADMPEDIPYFKKGSQVADAPSKPCPDTFPGIPAAPAMRGLKGINIHAYVHNRELLANPDGFPKELEPEKLVTLYTPRIKEMLLGLVEHDDMCRTAPIIIVSSAKVFETVSAPNTLTVSIRVDMIEDLKPAIAVMTVSYYRPEHMLGDYGTAVLAGNVIAFPLSLPAKEFEARLNAFVDSSIKEPLMVEP